MFHEDLISNDNRLDTKRAYATLECTMEQREHRPVGAVDGGWLNGSVLVLAVAGRLPHRRGHLFLLYSAKSVLRRSS